MRRLNIVKSESTRSFHLPCDPLPCDPHPPFRLASIRSLFDQSGRLHVDVRPDGALQSRARGTAKAARQPIGRSRPNWALVNGVIVVMVYLLRRPFRSWLCSLRYGVARTLGR